jgi:hypothetical protein
MYQELQAYGGGEIQLHTFLVWARDGGVWSASFLCCLTPREIVQVHVGQKAKWDHETVWTIWTKKSGRATKIIKRKTQRQKWESHNKKLECYHIIYDIVQTSTSRNVLSVKSHKMQQHFSDGSRCALPYDAARSVGVLFCTCSKGQSSNTGLHPMLKMEQKGNSHSVALPRDRAAAAGRRS